MQRKPSTALIWFDNALEKEVCSWWKHLRVKFTSLQDLTFSQVV